MPNALREKENGEGYTLLSSPGDQKERRSSVSGVWGGAPAENDFCAFYT